MANLAQSSLNLTLGVVDRVTPALQTVGQGLSVVVGHVKTLTAGFVDLAAKTGDFVGNAVAELSKLPQAVQDFSDQLIQIEPILEKFAGKLEDVSQYSSAEALAGFGGAVSTSLKVLIPQFNNVSVAVEGFAGRISKTLLPVITILDKGLLGIVGTFQKFSHDLSSVSERFARLFAFLDGPHEMKLVFDALRGSVGQVATKIFQVTQEIGLFGLGLQSLKQLVDAGPFAALIGQNEQLRQQLLSTQSALVGTSQITKDGQEVKDPTEAIKSLSGPVKSAIADLRQGSLDLVGVTSKDLVPVFQIVAQQITQIGAGLDDATSLSLDFAAALGTFGVPLFQANQEIRSILTSTIDYNSILAKNLGITNQQVDKWKAQGTLVKELTKLLAAARAGNLLNAQSLSGIASNVQEVFDEITRRAGEPLLDPLIKELDRFYQYLKTNTDALSKYIGGIAENGLTAFKSLLASVELIFNSIKDAIATVPVYLFQTLANGAMSFNNAIKGVLPVLQPFIDAFARIAPLAISAAGPLFTLWLQFKALQLGAAFVTKSLGLLMALVPGLGEMLYVLQGRTSGFFGTLIGLNGVLGPVGALLLTLGKNLGSIGPLSAAVAGSFPILGSALAKQIPLFSTFTIALVGASKQSPILREALGQLAKVVGGLAGPSAKGAQGLVALGKGLGFTGQQLAAMVSAAGLPTLASNIAGVSTELTKGTVATTLWGKVLSTTRTAILGFLTGPFVMTAAFIGLAIAVNEFILKNETMMSGLRALFGFLGDSIGLIFNALTNPITLAASAFVGLAVAIYTQTIPAMLSFIAVNMVEWLAGAAIAMANFSKVLAGIKLVEASAGAFQMAQGLGILSTALTGGTGALAAFGTGLAGVAAGAAALLGPLLAIAGVVAAGALYYSSKKLEDERLAFEELSRQSNQYIGTALEQAAKLKAARDKTAEAQKTGIALSAQEIEANRKAVVRAGLEVKNLEANVKTLKEFQKAAPEELKSSYDAQIQSGELAIKTLQKYIDNVQIAAKTLPILGDTYTQLAQKADSALKAIKNPVGDPEIFKKKIEEYQKVTEEQIQIGAISYREAEKRYRQISQLTTLEAEQQIKAAEMAVAARKAQVKEEVDLTNSLVEARKAAIASGSIEEFSGFQSVFKLQRESLIKQRKETLDLLIIEEKAGRGRGRIAKELYLEKRSLELQLTTLAQEQLNKRIELESKYVALAQARLADTIAQAEQSALQQTQALVNRREITQTQADQRRVNSTRDRLQKELALEQANLQALQEDIEKSNNPEKRVEQERNIRASKLKTAQLTTQLAEQEQRDQEALTKVIQERIGLEQKAMTNLAERQTQAYQKQLELLGRLSTVLEYQNKLMESRKDLQGTIGDYLQTEYKILVDAAKTDDEKQRLTRKGAELELRFLAQRQKMDRESLEIKLRIQKAEDARLLIQNQADQAQAVASLKQAQAELAKASAAKDTPKEELEALQVSIEAATAKLDAERFKGQSLGAQAEFNLSQDPFARKQLQLQQSAQLDEKRFAYGKTLPEDKQGKYIDNLRRDIYGRLRSSGFGPDDPKRTGPYTPEVGSLGRIDPNTGVFTPAPKITTPKVSSFELPTLKDVLKSTSDFTQVLKEQVDFRPANKSLERLVRLSTETNDLLVLLGNDPRLQVTNNYTQVEAGRSRPTRGLPR